MSKAVTWSLDDINVDVIGKASKTPLDEIKRNTAELDDLLGSLRLMGSPKIDSFEMTLAGLKAKFDQTKAASDSLERYFGIRAGSQCPDDDDQDISLFALLFEFLNKIGTT